MRRTMGQKSEHHSRGHYGPSICPDPHSHDLDAAPAKFEGLQQGRGRITAPLIGGICRPGLTISTNILRLAKSKPKPKPEMGGPLVSVPGRELD